MHHTTARVIAGLSTAVMAAGFVAASAAGASATVDPVDTVDPRLDTVYGFADDTTSVGSIGFTAWSMEEIGERIVLGGTARELETVSVTLQSYACEAGAWNKDTCQTGEDATGFTHPVTVNIYEVEDLETPLATLTQDELIPFRPSADPEQCNAGNAKVGYYWDADLERCASSVLHTATFDFSSLGAALPDEVVVGVHAPSSRFYASEYPSGGYYDSLNVALASAPATSGTDADMDVLYFDSTYSGAFYTGGQTPEHGVLKASAGWYGEDEVEGWYYTPLISVTATPGTTIVEVGSSVEGFEGEGSSLGLVEPVSIASGLTPASGCFFAVAPVTGYSTHGSEGFVSTRYAGYSTLFPEGGYTASADFYLDAAAEEGQFTWSHALNGTNGDHARDFVFVAGADGAGAWTVGVANGVNRTGLTAYGEETLEISESGWYTFEHTAYAGDDNLLYVDLTVLDAAGAELASWTLGGQAADVIPTVVGGNRYGWLVTNSYDGLPVDNVLLNAERPAAGCTPFEDVVWTSHFAAEIAWMNHAGLANGWTTETGAVYRPLANVNRDVMAAFLYRLDGADEYYEAPEESYFTDVPTDHVFFTQISWLYDSGITTGWENKDGSLRFQPTTPVNRDMMAAFLYRFAGEPEFDALESLDFTDVPASQPFAEEIAWLSATGITTGWTMADESVEFRPTSPVKRDQMAAFVYRFTAAFSG